MLRVVAAALVTSVVALLPVGTAVAAQEDPPPIERQLQESRQRLEQIRAERDRLQREMEGVRSRVRDVTDDLANIERQLSASRSVIEELDFQIEVTSEEVERSSRELAATREELRESSAVLSRRLRDIYKLGPLHTARVLLAAESFSDLVTRYRYLRIIAQYDQTLVDRVERLERALVAQNRELQQSLEELGQLRQSQLGEVAQLRAVERERQQTLEEFRDREREALSRLDQLEADEERMTSLIDDLDARRLEMERRSRLSGAPEPGSASMAPEDAGTLDWPVDGELIYRFGRERRPDGTVLRWNGVGIAARPGTPVRAVQEGTVVMAGPFEGYGPTVVVSHGDGFYTLYLYLEEIGVVQGRRIERGQVVGTVGGSDTPEGPHIEFQVRGPVNGGTPQAMDPLTWLRERGSGAP